MLLELRIPRSKCKMGIKEVMVGIVAVFYGHNGAKARRMPHKRDYDEAGHLQKWEEILGWDELHFGRHVFINVI
ncbi:hypothetical protein K1719_047547 [Acacia pycnantha]|nr:hypothetical protein K1719_047547 [Acacia pycnantha]